MDNLIEMKKDDRPRRGVVLALDHHFQKYNPEVLSDLDQVSLFRDNDNLLDDNLLDDGPEAA